jgi:hypothetical protein
MLPMRPAAVALPVAFLLALGGCARPGDDGGGLLPTHPRASDDPGEVAAPETTEPDALPGGTESATPRPTGSVSASPSSTAFATTVVVPCNGRPAAEQVIAVVKQHGSLIGSGAGVSVATAPQCAGTWQYTILNVSNHEPLQVVTKGAPTALTFVTAGTSVCTTEVLAAAPPALLTTAGC